MDKIISGYREFAEQFLDRQILVIQKFKVILAERFTDCVSPDELILNFSQDLEVAQQSLFVGSKPGSFTDFYDLQKMLTIVSREYVEKYRDYVVQNVNLKTLP